MAAVARRRRDDHPAVDADGLGLGQAGVGGEQRRLVGALPRQVQVRPAEVAVRRGLAVDRPAQVERRDDRRRAQVEVALDERLDLGVVDACRSRTTRRVKLIGRAIPMP